MSSVWSEGELSLGCDVTQNQLSLKMPREVTLSGLQRKLYAWGKTSRNVCEDDHR